MVNSQFLRLQDIEQMMFKGKYDEALSDLDFFLKEEELQKEARFEGLFLKCKILYQKNDYTGGLQLAEQILKESQGIGIHEVDAYIAKAEALMLLYKSDESLETLTKGEKVLESLTEVPSFELKKRQALVMNVHGLICWRNDDFDRMLEYAHQALALHKEIGNKYDIAQSLHQIGLGHHEKGHMDQALVYYQQALPLREELGDKKGIAKTLNNIGTCYYRQGFLKQGMEHLIQSLRYSEEIGVNKDLIGSNFYNIANIAYQLGELDKAKQYLEQALPLFDEINQPFCAIATCYLLTKVTHKTDSPDEAQRYLQQLQQIQDQAPTSRLAESARQLRLLGKALSLKANPRIRAKFEAQEILQQLSEYKFFSPYFNMDVFFNLCELLLDEFKFYNEITVLQEAETVVQKTLKLGQDYKSFPLVVKTLLLQAKFALVQGNLTGATSFLDQANLIAEEYGLISLAKQVSEEKKRLDDQFVQWQDLIQRNAPFQERIEKAELFEYIKEAKNIAVRQALMPTTS